MKITVTMADREAWVVDTRPIDNVRFEDTARKHRWGTVQDSPMRYMYFLAYAASTRNGHFPVSKGFDAFLDELVDVDAEDEATANDGPNPPEAGDA